MKSEMGDGSAAHKIHIGKLGEDMAATYLRNKGWKILERNYKARYGERDIVARDHETLVFVEVKTRIGDRYGTPEESVTPRKLREVVETAQFYKTLHPNLPDSLRIDVIGIVLDPEAKSPIYFNHTENVTL